MGMTRALTLVVVAGVGLGACSRISDSGLNPFGWFGGARETVAVSAATGLPADTRPLVDQITELNVMRTPYGALVSARGLPPTQGYYDAELVALNRGYPVDGVLRYEFRASPPPAPNRAGTVPSREIVVGARVSNARLAGVQRIEVVGARNRQSVARR